jgi:tRNA uridine 5-carbamoylmethylation protein Kti12
LIFSTLIYKFTAKFPKINYRWNSVLFIIYHCDHCQIFLDFKNKKSPFKSKISQVNFSKKLKLFKNYIYLKIKNTRKRWEMIFKRMQGAIFHEANNLYN